MIIHNPILTGSFTVNGTDVSSITSSAASLTSLNDYTASQNNRNGTYATTGSNTFAGIQTVNSNLVVTGSITAQTLVVQTITSSVDFVTGSTRFGSVIGNTHQFTGSIGISGSLSGVGATFSGDVGIGTTSPQRQFTINSSFPVLQLTNPTTGTTSNDGLLIFQSGLNGTISNQESGSLSFETNNTLRAIITSGGNVGIANAAPQGKLHIGDALFNVADASNGLILKQTGTNETTGIYLERSGERKGYAIYVGGSLDSLVFQRNNAGTKSDVMTLTRDGNVGIGTSSPNDLFEVRGGFIRLSATAGNGPQLNIYSNGQTSNHVTLAQGFALATDNIGYLYNRANADFVFGTNNSEKMRILANGNVGIGVTNPSAKLYVVGGTSTYVSTSTVDYSIAIQDPTSMAINVGGSILFQGYKTGTAAIGNFGFITGKKENGNSGDEAGFLGLGTFNASGIGFERIRITSAGVVSINNSGAEANAGLDRFTLGCFVSNYGWLQTWASVPLYFNRLGNAVYAGTQRIDNNSDERIKENIISVENALDTVLNLQGRKFNMIDENNKLRYGFVAQEVQPHLADFVTESDRSFEKDDIKIENLLTLETSGAAWAALLVEAIKELKAEIDELKNK